MKYEVTTSVGERTESCVLISHSLPLDRDYLKNEGRLKGTDQFKSPLGDWAMARMVTSISVRPRLKVVR